VDGVDYMTDRRVDIANIEMQGTSVVLYYRAAIGQLQLIAVSQVQRRQNGKVDSTFSDIFSGKVILEIVRGEGVDDEARCFASMPRVAVDRSRRSYAVF
jgi:hypothetical protein